MEAGHRAVMFNRIGGLSDEIYKEGLHFRIPWFQYPVVYDIRARPNQVFLFNFCYILFGKEIKFLKTRKK